MILKSLLIFILLSCSTARRREMKQIKDKDISKNFKKDYKVRDASSELRPGWIVDANLWAKKLKYNTKEFRYYSFETEPKVSREISCDLAKANARADVASEITTFISKSLNQSQSGIANIDPNAPAVNPMRSYVDRSLVEKIQNVLVGTSVEKTYWEKREYRKKWGAKGDFQGFTCATFLRVANDDIKKSIDQVRMDMVNRAAPDMKEKMKESMEKASQDYFKLRGM